MVSGGLAAAWHTALSGRLRVAQECMLYLLRLRRKYKVANHSMQPALNAGDFVLVNPSAFLKRSPLVGDIVVAKHPNQSLVLVKRVAGVDGDSIKLASDNVSVGEDSRHFGDLSKDHLLGLVTAVIT